MLFILNNAIMRYENGLFYRFQYGKWKLKKTVFHHNYYRLQIMTNKICKDYYVQRIVYWLNNPEWNKEDTKMQIDHIGTVIQKIMI
jgi:hypothetical protein